MAAQQQKALRVGVIQGGKIVEERLMPARQTVTIGTSEKNTIVAPQSGLPESFTVFTYEGDRATLHFEEGMDGKVDGPAGSTDLGTLVTQVDRHTPIQIGHLAETLRQDVKVVVACLHYLQVRQEGGDGACIVLFDEIHFEQRRDSYTSFVTLTVENAIAFDIDLAPLR